jgi:HK97 family phage major capsid protein
MPENLNDQSRTLLKQAQDLLTTTDEEGRINPEDLEQGQKLMNEGLALRKRATNLKSITDAMTEMEREAEEKADPEPRSGFKSLPEFWQAIAQAGDWEYRGPLHKGLMKLDKAEHLAVPIGSKALAEGVGATGGFLVPTEYIAQLYAMVYETNPIRNLATIIPMRRRQVTIPVLDQTDTTAGTSAMFGGITAKWTEEASQKAETDPSFREINLVAHKLVCYTRVSDELLDDSAIALDAFLRGPLGFGGAIAWHEEYAFLRGTGAGQPLGVINAGATYTHARAADGAFGVADVVGMLSHFYGERPTWHFSRSMMSNLLQMNGPAGNASYVFIPNAREGAPDTLFGFPVYYTEKLPNVGTTGDVVLADWRYYLVGDRMATTVDSTTVERFQYDQTSWRAVHRVDGQPWLSTPITLADGTHQISPFVILGEKSS